MNCDRKRAVAIGRFSYYNVIKMASPSPLTLQSYELVHNQLRNQLINNILPKTFPSFARELRKLHQDIYPVVVGGSVLQNCVRSNVKAHKFIHDLFSEDVDIKVVIGTKNKISNESLDIVRKKFLTRIAKKLKTYVQSNKDILETQVTTKISDKLMNHPLEHIRKSRVLTLENEYTETFGKHTLSILDTSVYAENTVAHYNNYHDLVRSASNVSPNVPIPYQKENGVNYASCNYAYYDTVRMMLDRSHFFEEKRSIYALIKLSRYIVKFMSLYVLLKNQNIDPSIQKIYINVHKMLKTAQKKRNTDNDKIFRYKTPVVNNMNRLIQKVIKVSNIQELVKIVDKSFAFRS